MKPYISKLIAMKLLDHKGGFALDVGCGDGADSKEFEALGYSVYPFDIKNGHNLLTFDYDEGKYDFINCNNVLPFVENKIQAEIVMLSMAMALRPGGTLHFTLFGVNDGWSKNPKMSFYSFDEANKLVDTMGLKVVSRSSDEFIGKTMAGDEKYWHILRFILVRE